MINVSNKYGKQLLDNATKTGLNALKTAFKKVVHKGVGATGEFTGNKNADKIVKPKTYLVRIHKMLQASLQKLFQVIKRFNCIKVCVKKVDGNK